MRVLVYEFVTGGGWLQEADTPPPPSLLAEGSAMVHALTGDLTLLPDVQLAVLWDARLPRLQAFGDDVTVHVVEADSAKQVLENCAKVADLTIVIAPEFNQHLSRIAADVLAVGGTLLGPAPGLIQLCADKQRTAEHLERHDVPVAQGQRLSTVQGGGWPTGPLVIKPCDGAGSQGVRLLTRRLPKQDPAWQEPDRWRLERFYPGQAASLSLLCGPGNQIAMPPFSQLLSSDGCFSYLGGSYPIADPLALRAGRLATAAVATLPDPCGYIGVDLVLGAADDGTMDVVIEINPRLTTSYVGLRAICQQNLAAAMVRVARGDTSALSFDRRAISFDATGQLTPVLRAAV